MKNIGKILLGMVVVCKLMILPSVLFTADDATASLPKAIVPKENLIDLQGYIIGEPQYISATNEWQFKFAPKKNKDLQDIYMIVTVPKTQKKYYLGDYVKIQTRPSTIQAAIAAKNRSIATE